METVDANFGKNTYILNFIFLRDVLFSLKKSLEIWFLVFPTKNAY